MHVRLRGPHTYDFFPRVEILQELNETKTVKLSLSWKFKPVLVFTGYLNIYLSGSSLP